MEEKGDSLICPYIKKDKRVQKVSNTIENQLFLLRSYVSDNAICGEQEDIHEFTDDGYSGTDRKRPSFMKMLAWVELEKIDTVIVKDFSRLSRIIFLYLN